MFPNYNTCHKHKMIYFYKQIFFNSTPKIIFVFEGSRKKILVKRIIFSLSTYLFIVYLSRHVVILQILQLNHEIGILYNFIFAITNHVKRIKIKCSFAQFSVSQTFLNNDTLKRSENFTTHQKCFGNLYRRKRFIFTHLLLYENRSYSIAALKPKSKLEIHHQC